MKHPLKAIKSAALAAILCTAFAGKAVAGPQDGFGVGIIAGEPTGLSVKQYIDSNHAYDAAFAYSLSDGHFFQFHADYLVNNHSDSLNPPELKGSLPWYYGIGGRIRADDGHTRLGMRIPFGITYLFADAPLDFFAEVVPVVDVAPNVSVRLNGAVGLHVFIK